MNVRYMMSREPVTCSPSDSLKMAAGLMWDHDCGALPVVDPDGRLVGIITDRDICMATYSHGEPVHGVPVERAMTRDAVACNANDTAARVADLMCAHRVRRLPVVDEDGHVVGIVSIHDLARESARLGHEPTQLGLAPADVVRAISLICEPPEERTQPGLGA